MIDLARETILTLEEAAECVKVTKDAVIKWYRVGVGGRRLETVKVGGARRTSVEALSRFATHPEPIPTVSYATESAHQAQEFIRSLQDRKQRDTGGKAKKKEVPA